MFFNESDEQKDIELTASGDVSTQETDIDSEGYTDIGFGLEPDVVDYVHQQSSDLTAPNDVSLEDLTLEEVTGDTLAVIDDQTTIDDNERVNEAEDLTLEEVTGDTLAVIDDQTTIDDTVHEAADDMLADPNAEGNVSEGAIGDSETLDESVSPIAFSEKNVRVFQRSDCNLIMESDFSAVSAYYNYQLSEAEVLQQIAQYHNISEDSIKVYCEEVIPKGVNRAISNKKNKKVSAIDNQIKSLLEKKKKMTPDAWIKCGWDTKLKQLRARKTLSK